MFFTYNQNNSGGSFQFDEKAGISHYVIIEANTAEEADNRAEEIGLYFNGVDQDLDCPCCGDRWYPTFDSGDEIPSVYGEPVAINSKMDLPEYNFKWMKNKPETFIHYLDGRVVPADL